MNEKRAANQSHVAGKSKKKFAVEQYMQTDANLLIEQ